MVSSGLLVSTLEIERHKAAIAKHLHWRSHPKTVPPDRLSCRAVGVVAIRLSRCAIAPRKTLKSTLAFDEISEAPQLPGLYAWYAICCQICGFSFPETVINRFLGGSSLEHLSHNFYDFLKPTYRSPKDYQIEVDHIKPITRGGTNELRNLQLLCGFCNRSKRDFTTVFDTSIKGIELAHPILGQVRLSSWFLVVRMLAGNYCYFCHKDASNTELTIAPLVLSCEINPVNVCVTCYGCDPIKQHRYISVPKAQT